LLLDGLEIWNGLLEMVAIGEGDGKLELRAKRGGSSVELREMGESGGVLSNFQFTLHESDDESRLLLE